MDYNPFYLLIKLFQPISSPIFQRIDQIANFKLMAIEIYLFMLYIVFVKYFL